MSSSPGGNEALIEQTIMAADDGLIEQYKEYLDLAPSLRSMPYYSKANASQWINRKKFGKFLQKLTRQSVSPEAPRRAEKRVRPSSPTPSGVIDISDGEDQQSRRSRSTVSSVASKVVQKVTATVASVASSIGKVKTVAKKLQTSASAALETRPPKKKAKTNAKATVRDGIEVTTRLTVKRVERLDALPTTWAVPRESTAVVIDLTGKTPPPSKTQPGKPATVDGWLKQECQDSWKPQTNGGANNAANVALLDGVRCRRVELDCKGASQCEHFDPTLLGDYERYDATPDGKWEEIVAARARQEVGERETVLGNTAAFFRSMVNQACPREKCKGTAVLKAYEAGPRDGKTHFVGCSKWRHVDGHDHIEHAIPGYVDEAELVRLFRGEPLTRVADAKKYEGKHCAGMEHPRTGLKLKSCKFTHVIDGKGAVGKMGYKDCPAHMTIYVPLDRSDQRAVVVVQTTPHNHPVWPELKPTAEAVADAKLAMNAAGGISAKPAEVDAGRTTTALFDGQTLSEKHPSFQDARKLRKLVHSQKLEESPLGLEFLGVVHASQQELKLPPEERYIHAVSQFGDIHIVVTMTVHLAKYIHSLPWFASDYTYKRVLDLFNEWEVASFIAGLNRNVTLARIYCNKESTEAFEIIWEAFFDAVEKVTGKPLLFKAFHKAGALKAIICDGDAAQAHALGNYFLKINDPDVSGISEKDRDRILLYVFKSCWFHFCQNADALAKQGVSAEDIQRIKGYRNLMDAADRAAFCEWCKGHENAGVRNWYANKANLPWFLPSVNKFESLMDIDDWDTTASTSNSSESAHVQTNRSTGIRNTLLQAINLARDFDFRVASELATASHNGILRNKNNSYQDLIKAQVKRSEAKAKKSRVAKENTASKSKGRTKKATSVSVSHMAIEIDPPGLDDTTFDTLPSSPVPSPPAFPLSHDALPSASLSLPLYAPGPSRYVERPPSAYTVATPMSSLSPSLSNPGYLSGNHVVGPVSESLSNYPSSSFASSSFAYPPSSYYTGGQWPA